MQTRALPKITCHKLSKTKFFCACVCVFFFFFFFSQLKLRSISCVELMHFQRTEFFDGSRDERRALPSFVGKDRFRTIGDLNSSVPLKMTTNELEAAVGSLKTETQCTLLLWLKGVFITFFEPHVHGKVFATKDADHVGFTHQWHLIYFTFGWGLNTRGWKRDQRPSKTAGDILSIIYERERGNIKDTL